MDHIMKPTKKHLLSRKFRPVKRGCKMRVEELEARCLLSVSGFRPIDEVGNNIANPNWGVAATDLLRLTPAKYSAYVKGVDSPSLPQDPSPRLISDIVNNQADPTAPFNDIATVNKQSLSDFAYTFGQFMDHGMDLTLDNGPSMPIPVPKGDPIGGPNDTPLAFQRSNVDPKTGSGPNNPAQQINSVTSFLDLSQVYGSDLATDDALRTFIGGQMKTSLGGLPPLDNSTYFTVTQLATINASVGGMQDDGPLPQSDMFVTGDTRGNENVELTALQTLFLDNHNRIAAELQAQHPNLSDEQLFQEARKINLAQFQSIVYNEWIPAVLGPNALSRYAGYNPNVNPGIDNEFSTVAFRFGHSLISGNVARDESDGLSNVPSVPLAVDFFDPHILNGQGLPSTTDPVTGLPTTSIGPVLQGDADSDAQAEDVQIINEIRNLLFNEVVPGVGYGQDLISLDIERARDHGIGSYNQVRVGLGLPAVTSFAQITSNVQVQQELQEAYGNVNNIDPIEGGLAENLAPGANVGPLFLTIMVKQFTALRHGDRFFYLNETWTPEELKIFDRGDTLAKVIYANTGVQVQPDAFIFKASIHGTVYSLNGFQRERAAGITVELEKPSQDHLFFNIVATRVTNAQGNYSFNQLSGPSGNPLNSPGVSSTGDYNVAIVLPSGNVQISPDPGTILISQGDMNVKGVDFLITSNPGWETAAVNSGGRGLTNHHVVVLEATKSGGPAASPAIAQASDGTKPVTFADSGNEFPPGGEALDNGLDDWLFGQSIARSLLTYSERKTQAAR
jgi:peroxidase